MSTIFHLPLDIRSEFSVDESGKAYATQSGVGRLCGVRQQSINELLEKLATGKLVSESLEPFAGNDYRGTGKTIPDLVVMAIVNHYAMYARKTTEQAKIVSLCFQSVGFRVWLQKELGWKKEQKKLSLEEIAFFANFASETAQNAGVSKAVAESLKLDSIRRLAPAAEPLLMLHKKAIASANPLPEKALSPTELGVILSKKLGIAKVSARAINKKLIELEYQVSIKRVRKSNGKTVHDYYKPTQKGEAYSQLEMSAYPVKEANSTKYQLRWFSGIIEILVSEWAK